MDAEARGFVKALLQPDPSVRLTAEQTLLHPWVKAMASTCRQRALTDKAQKKTGGSGGQPDTDQEHVRTSSAEAEADKAAGYSRRCGDMETSERHTDLKTERRKDEVKLQQQQQETNRVEISPQLKVHTTSEVKSGEHRPGCPSTDPETPVREHSKQEIQDSDPAETSQGASLSQLSAPADHTESPALSETPSKPNSQQETPLYSTHPITQEQVSIVGHQNPL